MVNQLPTATEVPRQRGQAEPERDGRDAGSTIALAALRAGARTGAVLIISGVVLVGLWAGLLWLLNVSSFVGKRPWDVWKYLFNVPAAAANRSLMLHDLATTLGDASIGFVAGLVAATAVSAIFTLVRPIEYVFMPLAMLLRSVPLVAMAPVIGLVTGRGVAGAATISGIVVFFPVLVNVSLGLRSAPASSLDLIRVNGGGKWSALRKVGVPSALPSLFASIRISVPGAVIGAMLYEWLFSAKGLGAEIFRAAADVNYDEVWTIVVMVTASSIVIYSLVSVIESAVLAAWGPNAGRR
jgi:ABC-type nitrate/sulfonate/bicarbonate transport system permease component